MNPITGMVYWLDLGRSEGERINGGRYFGRGIFVVEKNGEKDMKRKSKNRGKSSRGEK